MTEFLKGQVVAGLSGIDLDFDVLELGRGLRIQKTYAHLMAPYMMAFTPAPPGGHHPAPWKAARGGFGFDVTAELVVPEDFESTLWESRLDLIRWIVALIRLWATPRVTVPVVSDLPFEKAAKAADEAVTLIPYEVLPRGIVLQVPEEGSLSRERLLWVVEQWESGATLTRNAAFHLAVEALDQAHFQRDSNLALVSTWAAIEGLFSPGKAELRFRVSALLASYLRPHGSERRALQKRLQKLYDSRSSAAHGKGRPDSDALVGTMQTLREAMIKMISEGHVPSHDDLDALLLGKDGDGDV